MLVVALSGYATYLPVMVVQQSDVQNTVHVAVLVFGWIEPPTLLVGCLYVRSV
jgi:hypothetical protein